MTGAVVSSIVLHCAGSLIAPSPEQKDLVAVMKLPFEGERAASVISRQPPVSRVVYVGEAGPSSEWAVAFAEDQHAASQGGAFKLARVAMSDDLLTPYSFRMGTAVRLGEGQYRFEEQARGKCSIMPNASELKGDRK